jgi:hypothetical protein
LLAGRARGRTVTHLWVAIMKNRHRRRWQKLLESSQ